MVDLSELAGRLRAEQAVADATRAELHAGIVESLAAGARQVDLVQATGYTRERIRVIAAGAAKRKAGPH